MLKPILTALLSIFLVHSQVLAGDSLRIKSYPILKKVIEAKKANFTVDLKPGSGIIKIGHPHFDNWDNRIIKTEENTYITINGTGQLFKIEKPQNDSLSLKRLDNTHYYGYNFFCINFEYNGDIYSFGGMGLWRVNGQLRIFSEIKKEWDIVPLNKETPAISDAYFFDRSQGKLYYLARSYMDISTNKNIQQDEWYVIDLNKKTTSLIGKVHPQILEAIHDQISSIRFKCYPLPDYQGTIITDHEKLFKFIQFSDMAMYEISNKQVLQTLKATAIGKLDNLFSVDSTFYYSLAYSDTLDSINKVGVFFDRNSKQDIVASAFPIRTYSFLFITLGILISGGALFYFRNRKNQHLADPQIEQKSINFDSLEKVLIQKLKENLYEGISIAEVNDLLGLTKKPISIQKKNRNDVILKINNKYKMMSMSKEDLIIRKRDENDKRSFIYFINEEAAIEAQAEN